jgi:hypothetical protein
MIEATPLRLEELEKLLIAEQQRRFGAAVLAGKVRRIITEDDADRDRQLAELGNPAFVIDRRIVDPPAGGVVCQ